MKTTAVPKNCKKCGVELLNIWYYCSKYITEEEHGSYNYRDGMENLDGPCCYNCLSEFK